MSADELIKTAIHRGLDAICVTDHLYAWGGREAQAISQRDAPLKVFRGVEARTTLGDVLVFGLDEDFSRHIDGYSVKVSGTVRGRLHGGASALWYLLNNLGEVFCAIPPLVKGGAHRQAVPSMVGLQL